MLVLGKDVARYCVLLLVKCEPDREGKYVSYITERLAHLWTALAHLLSDLAPHRE